RRRGAGAEQARRRRGGRRQRHVELATARRGGGDDGRRVLFGPGALLRAGVDPGPQDGDVVRRRRINTQRHPFFLVRSEDEPQDQALLAVAGQEQRLLVLGDGVEGVEGEAAGNVQLGQLLLVVADRAVLAQHRAHVL